ncbi:hypothetical protein EDD11_007281 [Mortierella claussenii]|nr:hypothetical protein EDD11_007281 [Mortierella claussenii]
MGSDNPASNGIHVKPNKHQSVVVEMGEEVLAEEDACWSENELRLIEFGPDLPTFDCGQQEPTETQVVTTNDAQELRSSITDYSAPLQPPRRDLYRRSLVHPLDTFIQQSKRQGQFEDVDASVELLRKRLADESSLKNQYRKTLSGLTSDLNQKKSASDGPGRWVDSSAPSCQGIKRGPDSLPSREFMNHGHKVGRGAWDFSRPKMGQGSSGRQHLRSHPARRLADLHNVKATVTPFWTGQDPDDCLAARWRNDLDFEHDLSHDRSFGSSSSSSANTKHIIYKPASKYRTHSRHPARQVGHKTVQIPPSEQVRAPCPISDSYGTTSCTVASASASPLWQDYTPSSLPTDDEYNYDSHSDKNSCSNRQQPLSVESDQVDIPVGVLLLFAEEMIENLMAKLLHEQHMNHLATVQWRRAMEEVGILKERLRGVWHGCARRQGGSSK